MNRITLIHRKGIVNDYEILEDDNGTNLIQIIWNGEIRCSIKNMNPNSDHEEIKNMKLYSSITEYRAVFLNGIRLVKNGRLITVPFWKFWRKY